jgi:Uma2 family endonuclease
VEQFRTLVADGPKADLIDGVIYIASPFSRRTKRLINFIATLIEAYSSSRGLGGEVFVNRFVFELSDVCALQPDVAYVRAQRLHLVAEHGMAGGPDIAIEIVSRESSGRDYEIKRRLYLEAGVSEYWILDPFQRRIRFLRLQDDRYEIVPLDNERKFTSSVLTGFWLDVNWIIERPLPNAYRCLAQVLPPQSS